MGKINLSLIFMFLVAIHNNYAQVGIGTTNPNTTTLLHVDNTAPLPTGQNTRPINAVEVDGKTAIIGSLKIKDGSEGLGKILVSDAEGNATWSDISNYNPKYLRRINYFSKTITNNNAGENINTSLVNTSAQSSNSTINNETNFTLPKGSYKITFIISWQRTNNQNTTINFSLNNNTTTLGSFEAGITSNLRRIEQSFTFGIIGNENLSINLRRITDANPNIQIYDSIIYIEKI